MLLWKVRKISYKFSFDLWHCWWTFVLESKRKLNTAGKKQVFIWIKFSTDNMPCLLPVLFLSSVEAMSSKHSWFAYCTCSVIHVFGCPPGDYMPMLSGRGGLGWVELGGGRAYVEGWGCSRAHPLLGCVNGFRVLLKNNILHLVIGYFHHLYRKRPFNLWRSEIA